MSGSISRGRASVLRVADEVRFYDVASAAQLLRDALAVVGRVDPPAELRVACFEHAANLLASGHRTIESVGLVPSGIAAPAARL